MSLNNYSLKEDIRFYWSARAATFDLAFGHRIPAGPEAAAWAKAIRQAIGETPRHVLELACGTGEVTNLLLALGHQVTALDFSDAMLARARAKHADKGNRVRFHLADAEATYLPEGGFDAIVCRHLVWTLTDPQAAFREWHRLLKPGGVLLFFDGDWAQPRPIGRIAQRLISLIDRVKGGDVHYDGAMSDNHAAIMARLPFGDGLRAEDVAPLLAVAGFDEIRISSHAGIARAQRRNADLRNKLRTLLYRRFILRAVKP
jgi:SAM-dependent methyltransferase